MREWERGNEGKRGEVKLGGWKKEGETERKRVGY